MLQELDLVVLTRDIVDYQLQGGDVGTVVRRYAEGAAFEVEFVTAAGASVAVLTLAPSDIRSFQAREILHARELAA